MDEAYAYTEEILKKLERRITREYSQAEKEMQKKLDNYLANFAAKDADKRALVEAGELSEEKYRKWRENQILVGKRWKDMRDKLAHDLLNANMTARGIVSRYMPDIYAEGFNFATFEAETGAGVDTGFTLYDHDAVARIIVENPDLLPEPGKETSRQIAEGKAIRWNKNQIQSVMLQGLLQGESMRELAKRLAKTVGDKDKASAMRNARTMTTGVHNSARLNGYRRARSYGIRLKKQWDAVLDMRTRDSHAVLDGETVDIDEMFSNGLMYPGDKEHGRPEEYYNCRCTMVSQIQGREDDYRTVRSTEGLNGMTYDEWKEWHRQRVVRKRFLREGEPLSPTYRRDLEQRYIYAEPKARRVYNKFIPNGGCVVDGKSRKSYTKDEKVRMNFKEDAKRSLAGRTWFHEHFHVIDQKAGYPSCTVAYRNALIEDCKNLEELFGAHSRQNRIKMLNQIRRRYGDYSTSVEDILSGYIGEWYPGAVGGHGRDYWSQNATLFMQEGFAQMGEASFDVKKIEMMKRYFPKSWEEYNRILERLL